MIKKNNPAGRLHEILKMARAKEGNWSIRKVWATVFNVSEEDTIDIYYNLGILHNLVTEIERKI